MKDGGTDLCAAWVRWLLFLGMGALLWGTPALGDIPPPRRMASWVPLIWPELPAAAPSSGGGPRIESMATELDLYPTVLAVRTSLRVQGGDTGAQGLLVGLPEASPQLGVIGHPLQFLSILVDGQKVTPQLVRARCGDEPKRLPPQATTDSAQAIRALLEGDHPPDSPQSAALCKQIAALHRSRRGVTIVYRGTENWWLWRLTLPPRGSARIDLRYLQRVASSAAGAEGPPGVNLDRSVEAIYLLSPGAGWPWADFGGTARVVLQLHGLAHAHKETYGLPPTTQDGQRFEWLITPGSSQADHAGMGLHLKQVWQGLPGHDVELAAYVRGAPPDVQIFDRVQRFYLDRRPASRWQWYKLYSFLRAQVSANIGAQGRRMAGSLLFHLRAARPEPAQQAADAACLAWLSPEALDLKEIEPDRDLLPDLPLEPFDRGQSAEIPDWLRHGRSSVDTQGEKVQAPYFILSAGAHAACQVHRALSYARIGLWVLFGLFGLASVLLGVRWRHRRNARSLAEPDMQ